MTKRIDSLTPEQESQMGPWADRWIDFGLCTDPADWAAWEVGARRCYAAAGVDWPGVVVRVQSPLVMCLAGPAAAAGISLVEGRRLGSVGAAVFGAVGDAVARAVIGAVGGAVRAVVDGAVFAAVGGAVNGAVNDEVRDAVGGSVGGAVNIAVRAAVLDAVRDAVNGAVGGSVGAAVDGAVLGAVRGAVRGAVDGVVDGAVLGAVRGAWWRYLGAGRWWVHGSAWTSYFRDVCGLVLEGDLWDRARAFEQTQQSAWAWWPHRRFVIVCDRPSAIHREQVSPRGWGSHRLHNDSGPAVAFRDGWGVWAIHGVRLTEQIVMRPETLTPADIMAINNAEVRRVAIERFGWPEFVEAAGLILVDECPDPANGDHALRLYNAPDGLLGFDARVLVCTNATPERDGTVRRFGLTVPVEIESALAAAAWTFDETAEDYAALEKAS